MTYAALTTRTNYSFLEGASHPHEMVQRAAELGIHALGITDTDGVCKVPADRAEQAAELLSAGLR